MYVTVCTREVELLIVLINELPVWLVILSPVVFALSAAIHVYVDVKLLVNGIVTVSPSQIVAPEGLVITGLGFIETVTDWGVPMQPKGVAVGVIVYATDSTELVLFVIVLIKGLPDCCVKLSPLVLTLSVAIHV